MRGKWCFLEVLLTKRKGIVASDVLAIVQVRQYPTPHRGLCIETVVSSTRKKERGLARVVQIPETFPDPAVNSGDKETSLGGRSLNVPCGKNSLLMSGTNGCALKEALQSNRMAVQLDADQKRIAYQKVKMATKECQSKNVEQDLMVDLDRANLITKTTCAAFEAMTKKLDFLCRTGMAVSDIQKLRKKKYFIAADVDHVRYMFILLHKFLRDEAVTGKVLVSHPRILNDNCSLLEEKLTFLKDSGIGEKAFRRIGTGAGTVLQLPIDRLQENVSYLQGMGCTTEAINAMVHRFPAILRLSVKTSMDPKICFFKSMGMTKDNILRVISLNPLILAASMDKNLVKKFRLFQEFGLSIEECCKTLGKYNVSSYKSILILVEVLKSFGLTVEDVARLLRVRPDVFSRSPETLRAKLDLLINVEKRNIAEIRRYPDILCYSMENRIIPRLNMLRAVGKLHTVSLSMLSYVNDAEFERRFIGNASVT